MALKFHEWETLFDQVRKKVKKERAVIDISTVDGFYGGMAQQLEVRKTDFLECHIAAGLENHASRRYGHLNARIIDEWSWYENKRPYFKIWPSICKPLVSFPLSIPESQITAPSGCRTILLRFPIDNEPVTGADNDKMCACLASYDRLEDALIIGISFHVLELDAKSKQDTTDGSFYFTSWNNESIESSIRNFELKTGKQSDSLSIAWIRLAVAVSLLANDQSIITPDVLSADRDRYESETDEAWKQRAVDRARRRGIVGWNIGADYEVCPHYRRPHFGLRYTGKGGTVPRIVPIKGAVVHRSKLTEVPTGYMLPDGTEVEK